MPKIPTYDQPTVAPQRAPGVAMPSAPAGAFGEDIAAGLGNAARNVFQAEQQAQHQANVVRVEDAANQLRSKQLEVTAWVQKMKGKNAFDPKQFGGQEGQSLEEIAAGMFDAEASGLDQDLANDAQRQMFRQARDRFRLDLQGQVQGHIAQQTQVVQADEFKGTMAVEQQNVGLNGYVNGRLDKPTVDQSLQRSLAAVDRFADAQGWSDDQRMAAKREAAGRIHGTIIERMMESRNVDGAKVYFQVHEKDMDPDMVKGLRKKIEDTSTSIQVLKDVSEIAATGKTLEEQYAELDKRYAGNPEARKEAYVELQHRYEIHQHSARMAKQENVGKLWDYFNPTIPGQARMSMDQIKRSPEWASLTGDERNKLLADWEQFGKRNENDPYLNAQRMLRYYNVITERDKDGNLVYPTLTDNQIRAHMGDLGPKLVQDLMADIYKYRTAPPDKIQHVQVDQDLLHAEAKKYGLIKGDKPTDAEKARLATLATQLKVLQQNSGQQWSYENTQKLIKSLVTPIVTERENWFQSHLLPGDWSTKKPLFQVMEEEQVPQAFIDSLNLSLRSRGVNLPLTAADRYQLYLDYKGRGMLDETGKIK